MRGYSKKRFPTIIGIHVSKREAEDRGMEAKINGH
jgi:hypothetical protein